MFTLTTDQQKALDYLAVWQKKPHKQYVCLGGYAGTGKTALLAKFRQKILEDNKKLKVAFCAFTGKAAQVLRNTLIEFNSIIKGDNISTIHSLIYEPIDDDFGNAISWKKKTEVNFDLIIIDEASMVSQSIWQDLLSFGIPILAVGDHGQLPPIGQDFSLMSDLDIKLSQIHRQAQESPIIKVSILARENGYIPVKKYSSQVIKYGNQDPDINSIIEELLLGFNEETLFLVGRNKTRIQLNNEIRANREIYNQTPQINDRVICLRNNWKKDIYNGMLGRIKSISPASDKNGKKHWYDVEIIIDDGNVYNGKISSYQFNNDSLVNSIPGLAFYKIGDLFDFGYCLTVHKAQGSQAKKVIVFEERNKYQTDEDWRRWLYTAVTRAQEELVVIGE